MDLYCHFLLGSLELRWCTAMSQGQNISPVRHCCQLGSKIGNSGNKSMHTYGNKHCVLYTLSIYGLQVLFY